MKTTSALVIVSAMLSGFAVLALSAQPNAAEELPGQFLPQSAEPSFAPVEYKNLPSSVTMLVRMSSHEVVAYIEARFKSKFSSARSYIALYEEEAILSKDYYFRRVRYTFTDQESGGIHGHCSQWVSVWFSPSGEIKGVYVSKPSCPV